MQKFVWGIPVSDHPRWLWQASFGVAFAALLLGVGLALGGSVPRANWMAIAAVALVAGVLSGWSVANAASQSLGAGGWLRSLVLAGLAIAGPLLGAVALATGRGVPSFAGVIGERGERTSAALPRALGLGLLVLTVIALEEALALSFDPRYRDFAFAPLTVAALPFALARWIAPDPAGPRALAETVAATILILCAVFIVWNETPANWQALWLAAALLAVAVSLARARAAPS
jgi:hypothetical protein